MRQQRIVIIAIGAVLAASLGTAVALVSGRDAAPAATAGGSVPTTAPAPPSSAAQPQPSTTAPAQPAATSTTSPRHTESTRGIERITDPAKAADHLYDAWRDGDRRDATKFASAEAVDAMFAVERSRGLKFSHCSFRLAGFDCVYVFTQPSESPDAIMRVEGGASAGWRVVSVWVLEQQRLSDPAKAAGHLYDAWRAGDRRDAAKFASAGAVSTMFAVPRQVLTFSGCAYQGGGYDCTYTGDRVVVMRVDGGASIGYGVNAVSVLAE
jgi:hypothetical protein